MIKITHTDGSCSWVNPDCIIKMRRLPAQTLLYLLEGKIINSSDDCETIATNVKHWHYEKGINPYTVTSSYTPSYGWQGNIPNYGLGGGYTIGAAPNTASVPAPNYGNIAPQHTACNTPTLAQMAGKIVPIITWLTIATVITVVTTAFAG